MIRLGSKSIDSMYLGNKAVKEAYLGSKKIWPEGISYEDAVAILTSEDGTITQYFESCTDAATYATENSDTNWNLTIRSGSIPLSCFRGLTNLISLTLEEGVSRVNYDAFKNCSGLTGDLIFPDSCTYIDNWSFQNCSGLTGKLRLSKSTTYIGHETFKSTMFTGSLSISNSINGVGSEAFAYCTGFDDDLTFFGTSNPSTNTSFAHSSFTVCKVPIDYENGLFCGLSVSKVIGGGTIDPSEAENGIYIYARNGLLSKVDDWDTNANDYAEGIAVITDNAKFIIKKGIGSTYQTCWSTSLYGVTVGSVYATDKTSAIADYAGYNNTQIIHEAAPDESTTNNAANYCLAQTITTTEKIIYGYLPAAGEVYEIYNNLDTINSALELIGSDILDSSKYGLCSTSQDDSTAWRIILGTSSAAGIAKSTVATDVFAIPLFQLIEEENY